MSQRDGWSIDGTIDSETNACRMSLDPTAAEWTPDYDAAAKVLVVFMYGRDATVGPNERLAVEQIVNAALTGVSRLDAGKVTR